MTFSESILPENVIFLLFLLCRGVFRPHIFNQFAFNQFAHTNVKIPAQLTDQSRIQSLKFVAAIAVEICARNIQCLADLIFRNPTLLQNLLNAEGQFAIIGIQW